MTETPRTEPAARPGSSGRVIGSLSLNLAVVLALGVAAWWRGALDLGIVLFLATMWTMSLIRVPLTLNPPPVARTEREGRERMLVTLVMLGMMALPALAIATPVLDFASYRTAVPILIFGAVTATLGLWLFWRSHADLGRYWSPVLEMREGHGLVTHGIYARIRHPMYSAIFLITCAQVAFLGNWIAGPAGFVAFTILFADRIGPEERMMEERFGEAWLSYAARTGTLLPLPRKDISHG